MNPYNAKKMPFNYEIDKELLILTAEANSKYGEYKAALNTLELDASYFLDSLLLTESYKSTQIEGTQITQDEMFYLKYLKQNDDNKEIQNLKAAIDFAKEAMGLHLFGMDQDGDAIPEATPLESLNFDKKTVPVLIDVFMPAVRDRVKTRFVKKTLSLNAAKRQQDIERQDD